MMFVVWSCMLVVVSSPAEAWTDARQEILRFWNSQPCQEASFTSVYGRAEIGPPWTLLKPGEGESRREGILRWQGDHYITVSHSIHTGAPQPTTRRVEWFDGKKTCRYDLDLDTGCLLPGEQGEDVPGPRIMQGCVFQTVTIPRIVRDGEERSQARSISYSLSLASGEVIECLFDLDHLQYPRTVVITMSGGAKVRTIEYGGSADAPSSIVVTTLSSGVPVGGTEEIQVRYVTRISMKSELATPFRPWYPAGVLVTDSDTTERIVTGGTCDQELEGQCQEFRRLSERPGPRFLGLREALHAFLEAEDNPYIGASVSECHRISASIEREIMEAYRCAATATYAALLQGGVGATEARRASLDRFGIEVVDLESIAAVVGKATGAPAQWRAASGIDAAGLEGTFLIGFEGSSADQVGHLVAVSLAGTRRQGVVFDFPSVPQAFPEGELEQPGTYIMRVGAGPAPSSGGHWGIKRLLTSSLILMSLLLAAWAIAFRRRQNVVRVPASSLLVIVWAMLVACGESVNPRPVLVVEFSDPSEPLALGSTHHIPVLLRNDGDEAVPVQLVSASCACLRVDIPKDVLLPGEAEEIKVVLQPRSRGASSVRAYVGPDIERAVVVELSFVGRGTMEVRPETVALVGRQDDSGRAFLEGEFEVLLDESIDGPPDLQMTAPPGVSIVLGEVRRIDRDDIGLEVRKYLVHAEPAVQLRGGESITVEAVVAPGSRESDVIKVWKP